MSAMRLRRLHADYQKLDEYVRRHPRLKLVQAEGDPPERYQLEYGLKSLRYVNDELKTVRSHLVEIILPGSYPRLPPQCRMLTPIFHPNIAPHAICIGDHWSPGEPLWSIVARIGEMIAYQTYNTKSPLNGQAARWVDENLEKLPLDPVSMLVEEDETPKDPDRGMALPRQKPIPPSQERSADVNTVASRFPDFPVVPRSGERAVRPVTTPPRDTADLQPSGSDLRSQGDDRKSEFEAPDRSDRPKPGRTPETSDAVMLIPCTECEAILRVKSTSAGKRVRCPNCQAIVTAPQPD
jgi:ubiquitin-protein ligase